ncbi:MAG TPA: nuclear transport factor 2 family protein [Aeromonadales bacterium]|nr:nuclear transport factor 2 family protein [Aeromonadales bacterium]
MIDTLKVWHKLVDNSEVNGLDELLDEDVIFYSPVVHMPQKGKQKTTQYLSAAFYLFRGNHFQYVKQIIDNSSAALEFELEIDGILVNGIDIIIWNDEGKIIEFKVLIRPLKAINLIHQKMAEMLERLKT